MASNTFLTCERNDASNQEPCHAFLNVKKYRLVFGAVTCHAFSKQFVKGFLLFYHKNMNEHFFRVGRPSWPPLEIMT